MANFYEEMDGEFHWMRHLEPEASPFTKQGEPPKYQWKTMFKPNADSVMKIMDMQAKGVKNQLKKDDAGQWYVNFNRPTEIKTKKATSTLSPPKVTKEDGTPITELVGNGSKGRIKVELYQHGTPNGGKAYAARWDSAVITDLVEYNRV
jgi:hypothetical protein